MTTVTLTDAQIHHIVIERMRWEPVDAASFLKFAIETDGRPQTLPSWAQQALDEYDRDNPVEPDTAS